VVALVARRAAPLDALVAALPAGRAAAFPCDVRDEDAVARAVEAVGARFAPVDLLINNAGIGRYRPFLATDRVETAAILETNLHGALHFLRAALPGMLARGHGHVVNVSSIAGRMYGMPYTSSYSATKHALCSVSDSMCSELQDFGISVACIEPGFFATSVLDNAVIPDPTGSVI
jgi:short-subunit dehydrogenase